MRLFASHVTPIATECVRVLLAANDIEWVAIEKASGQSYLERFLNDPEFQLFSNTTHYLVFETKWN